MFSILAVAFVSSYIICTNCNGVGYFEVKCPRCEGSGTVRNPRGNLIRLPDGSSTYRVPCSSCLRGVSKPGAKGTGKKKETCKTCHGQKKIKAPKCRE